MDFDLHGEYLVSLHGWNFELQTSACGLNMAWGDVTLQDKTDIADCVEYFGCYGDKEEDRVLQFGYEDSTSMSTAVRDRQTDRQSEWLTVLSRS